MSEEKEKSGEELILILLLCGLFGGYCLEYTLEFWISYLTNSCVDLGYFICILIGAVCYKNLADSNNYTKSPIFSLTLARVGAASFAALAAPFRRICAKCSGSCRSLANLAWNGSKVLTIVSASASLNAA